MYFYRPLIVLVTCYTTLTYCVQPEALQGGHDLQILGKLVRYFISTQPQDVALTEGVHIVSTAETGAQARASPGDDSVLGTVENYLQTHEVRVRLPEIISTESVGRSLKGALEDLNENDATGTGRGNKGGLGGGKGDGMGHILVLGLMMGKMLAALGIGGVGLLAMKALMVSAVALMLSVVIGLKKLIHSGHDDGGHTVIHAGHGHEYKRRKREMAANRAYRGWTNS